MCSSLLCVIWRSSTLRPLPGVNIRWCDIPSEERWAGGWFSDFRSPRLLFRANRLDLGVHTLEYANDLPVLM